MQAIIAGTISQTQKCLILAALTRKEKGRWCHWRDTCTVHSKLMSLYFMLTGPANLSTIPSVLVIVLALGKFLLW